MSPPNPFDIALVLQALLIDLALSGRVDGAVTTRRSALLLAAGLSLVMRVAAALAIAHAASAVGPRFAGGAALAWIAWRIAAGRPPLWRQNPARGNHMFAAAASLALGDLALSLDATIAIGGVGRHAPALTAFALVLSALLTSVAGGAIAQFIAPRRWIAALALASVAWASLTMMWEDLHIWFPSLVPAIPGALGGRAH